MQVQNLTDVIAIAAGGGHSVALREDGTVWAWGTNPNGQLGDGTTTRRTTPVQVQNLENVTAIAAGAGHSIALREDGTVWTWGWNTRSQLGDGTIQNRHMPGQVQNLTNITAIAAGIHHSAALGENGRVWAWGTNVNGQLGDGAATAYGRSPVQVQNLMNVTDISIAAHGNHSVASREGGTVWTWGQNDTGQLGDGTVANRRTPVQVQLLTNATAIAAGDNHSIGLREDGTVWAWGMNAHGQLGDDTITNRSTPVQVLGLDGHGFLNLRISSQHQPPTLGSSYIVIDAVSGNEYNVAVAVNNITDFNGLEITITYDSTVFDVTRLSRFTNEGATSVGRIQGTDITITHVSPGEIRFTVDKAIADGKTYSGVVNIVSFEAKRTQSSTIHISNQ